VEDIGKDEFAKSFIKMVSELAKTIGVMVCVEGVETQEQYDVISDMNVQLLQGYYYDKPMEAEDFVKKYL